MRHNFEPFYEPPIEPKPVLMQTISETELMRLLEIEKTAIELAKAFIDKNYSPTKLIITKCKLIDAVGDRL